MAGGLSGGVGAAIANPTDLVKVRMQADARVGSSSGTPTTTTTTKTTTTTTTTGTGTGTETRPRYVNTRDAFRSIYRREGWRGLYRGTSLTTQRAIVLTASQLPAYDHAKHYLLGGGGLEYGGGLDSGQPGHHNHHPGLHLKEGLLVHVVCSMFAGLVCATTTAPVDLIKSRYMNQSFVVVPGPGPSSSAGAGASSGAVSAPNQGTQGNQGVRGGRGHGAQGLRYRSNWDCLVQTVRVEGVRGLYKGWLATWLRLGPHTIVTFVMLEQLRNLAGVKPV